MFDQEKSPTGTISGGALDSDTREYSYAGPRAPVGVINPAGYFPVDSITASCVGACSVPDSGVFSTAWYPVQ